MVLTQKKNQPKGGSSTDEGNVVVVCAEGEAYEYFGLWLLRPDHEELFSLFQPCFRLVSDIPEMLQIRFLLKQVLSVSVFPKRKSWSTVLVSS